MDQRRVNGYLTLVAPSKGETGDAGVAPTDARQKRLTIYCEQELVRLGAAVGVFECERKRHPGR
jgi:hypothetical protein